MALLVPAGRPGELSRTASRPEQGTPAHPASSSSMRRRTVPQSSSPDSPNGRASGAPRVLRSTASGPSRGRRRPRRGSPTARRQCRRRRRPAVRAPFGGRCEHGQSCIRNFRRHWTSPRAEGNTLGHCVPVGQTAGHSCPGQGPAKTVGRTRRLFEVTAVLQGRSEVYVRTTERRKPHVSALRHTAWRPIVTSPR